MKHLIVANWKCNPVSLAEAKRLFSSVKNGLVKSDIKKIKNVAVVICPPFVYFPSAPEFFYRCRKIQALGLGAQDCFWEQKGAYTGEVSAQMLKNLGCQYVILGHSERRRYFKETNEIVNKKMKMALTAKLTPILCIGETEEEKNQEKTPEVLKAQLQGSLSGISARTFRLRPLIVAYEPIWAIGSGKPCSIELAQTMNLLIRKFVGRLYSPNVSKNLKVLYGGSVDSKNAKYYIKEAGFQGLLVGGASLKPKEFIKIVKTAG